MTRIATILACLALLAATAGCSLMEGSRPWPDERRIVARDWAKPQLPDNEPPVYCYRTLANVECHREPIPGAEARIVSSHDGPEDAAK
jgi:hypothetical protein